eukprot:16035-Pyramimonas_sp.AAC.1
MLPRAGVGEGAPLNAATDSFRPCARSAGSERAAAQSLSEDARGFTGSPGWRAAKARPPWASPPWRRRTGRRMTTPMFPFTSRSALTRR